MDNLKQQQIEALQVASDYCNKIANAIENIITEYTVERKEDTDEYMNHIMTGLNWIIQVFNGTQDLINHDAEVIHKDQVNSYVLELNEANNENDDAKRAEALRGILSFVQAFQKEASKY